MRLSTMSYRLRCHRGNHVCGVVTADPDVHDVKSETETFLQDYPQLPKVLLECFYDEKKNSFATVM